MGKSGTCVMCGAPVNWKVVCEDFADILERVDMYGPDSLTEHEQMVYYAFICSDDCFQDLRTKEVMI